MTEVDLARAIAAHEKCMERWEKLRKRFPRYRVTMHDLEAHLPPPRVHDWRKK